MSYYDSLTKVQSYDSTMITKNIGVKKTIPTYDTYELEFSPKNILRIINPIIYFDTRTDLKDNLFHNTTSLFVTTIIIGKDNYSCLSL